MKSNGRPRRNRTSGGRRPKVAACRSRRAHYLDIENLCGTPQPSPHVLELVMCRYREASDLDPVERLTVGCNHRAAADIAFTLGLSGAQLQRRSGPDGADRVLIEVIIDDVVSGRVSDVVLGTGDGIFARELSLIRSCVNRLLVVGRAGSINRSLLSFADDVISFEHEEPDDAR